MDDNRTELHRFQDILTAHGVRWMDSPIPYGERIAFFPEGERGGVWFAEQLLRGSVGLSVRTYGSARDCARLCGLEDE